MLADLGNKLKDALCFGNNLGTDSVSGQENDCGLLGGNGHCVYVWGVSLEQGVGKSVQTFRYFVGKGV